MRLEHTSRWRQVFKEANSCVNAVRGFAVVVVTLNDGRRRTRMKQLVVVETVMDEDEKAGAHRLKASFCGSHHHLFFLCHAREDYWCSAC